MDRSDIQAVARGACRAVRDCPALLIATAARIRGLAEGARSRKHRMGPLNHAETRRAIEALWPQEKPSTPPGLLDAVERVTGGVPLFIEEICQWMAENADRRRPVGAHRHAQQASVFESVLEARLETLGPAREVARAAAVAATGSVRNCCERCCPNSTDETIATRSMHSRGRLHHPVRPSGSPALWLPPCADPGDDLQRTLRKRGRPCIGACIRCEQRTTWPAVADDRGAR